MTAPSPQDWFGHAIGLWATIADFRKELMTNSLGRKKSSRFLLTPQTIENTLGESGKLSRASLQ